MPMKKTGTPVHVTPVAEDAFDEVFGVMQTTSLPVEVAAEVYEAEGYSPILDLTDLPELPDSTLVPRPQWTEVHPDPDPAMQKMVDDAMKDRDTVLFQSMGVPAEMLGLKDPADEFTGSADGLPMLEADIKAGMFEEFKGATADVESVYPYDMAPILTNHLLRDNINEPPVPPGGWRSIIHHEDTRVFYGINLANRAPIPPDMVEYLVTLISPPAPHPKALFLGEIEHVDFEKLKAVPDATLTGIIVRGTATPEQSAEFLRVLRPGAHFVLIAPDEQPTGHTGACNIEDAGFEIRDSILWIREPGSFHYVPKASRAEREAGCEMLPARSGAEAVERKEGSAGVNNPRAGAGRTAESVRNHHPCLHPDALVLTVEGYRPIQEVKVGQLVYAADGKFHRVEDVSSHPYTHPHLFDIAVRGTNYTTPASNNHPFLIWRPTRKGKHVTGGEVIWAQADDLKIGDYTMTPISQCEDSVDGLVATDPDKMPEEFWFLFGLWLAEGVLQKAGHGTNAYPSFTLHENETHLIDAIKKYFEPRVNVGVYPKPGGKGVQVIAFDPQAGALFKNLGGCGASTKKLAPVVFEYPASVRKQILDGWIAGDGGTVRAYLQAKTVSPDLASQMIILAEEAGYHANLFRVEAKPGKIGNREFKKTLPSYTLQIYTQNAKQTDRKPSRPMTVTHEGVVYTLRQIKSITHVPYTGDVWNLTVEGSHTFQTAVGMSHNTVKPKELMERLLGNVPKIPGKPVVDPFHGSGTTGLATIETGHDFIGIDREPEYVTIATARTKHWHNQVKGERYLDIQIETDAQLPTAEEKPEVDFMDW